MEQKKPLRWRLVVFVAVVGMGFAVNVWQCVSLISETEDVLMITVTTSVGTVIGTGFPGVHARSVRPVEDRARAGLVGYLSGRGSPWTFTALTTGTFGP
jgi:hypothetical protein